MRIGSDRFVTAPAALRARVESADPSSARALAEVLDDHVVLRSGEARLAYTDRRWFRPRASDRVVRIEQDDALLVELGRSSDAEEWNESMSHDTWDHCYGTVEDGSLAAIASWQQWDATIAHVGVFTVAQARSRGLSTEVASAAVEHALASDYVPQWRVRVGNEPSWRVAQKLGFIEAGRQTFVALQPDT